MKSNRQEKIENCQGDLSDLYLSSKWAGTRPSPPIPVNRKMRGQVEHFSSCTIEFLLAQNKDHGIRRRSPWKAAPQPRRTNHHESREIIPDLPLPQETRKGEPVIPDRPLRPNHSYLNASTGSRRRAWSAGKSEARMHRTIDAAAMITTVNGRTSTGRCSKL